VLDFTNRDAMYMAAGPVGVPAEEERNGLTFGMQVTVAYRGKPAKARVTGFCTFAKFGVCFAFQLVYDPRDYHWDDHGSGGSSYWMPIAEEGITWLRAGKVDAETRAAFEVAAMME